MRWGLVPGTNISLELRLWSSNLHVVLYKEPRDSGRSLGPRSHVRKAVALTRAVASVHARILLVSNDWCRNTGTLERVVRDSSFVLAPRSATLHRRPSKETLAGAGLMSWWMTSLR